MDREVGKKQSMLDATATLQDFLISETGGLLFQQQNREDKALIRKKHSVRKFLHKAKTSREQRSTKICHWQRKAKKLLSLGPGSEKVGEMNKDFVTTTLSSYRFRG